MREEEDTIWNHPLLFWLRDCAIGEPLLIDEAEWRCSERFLKRPVEYEELVDGFLMSSLMRYIDGDHHQVVRKSLDSKADFQHLLLQINRFYEKNINSTEQHRIVMPDTHLLAQSNIHRECDLWRVKNAVRPLFYMLTMYASVNNTNIHCLLDTLFSLEHFPKCVKLYRIDWRTQKRTAINSSECTRKDSFEEVTKVILLILGCAIHSEKRKVFVNRITRFEQHIQAGLANYIQQLTAGTSCISRMPVEDGDDNQEEPKNQNPATRAGSPNSEHRFLTLQLANINHENRQLRTQAENKDEECRKLEVELEEKGKRITVLENERLRLLEKERHVKELNDDLQAARCRIEKLQQLESVEKKFREAKDEREFYKSKYEIVHKKNDALEDAIAELEKKLKTLQIENHDRGSVEENLLRMRNTVKGLEGDIGKKNAEIEALLDEKHRLNYELKEREDRIFQLEACSTTTTPRYIDSLADQLEDAKKDEVEIMKAEIRKLRAQTEGAIPKASEDIEDLKKKLSAEELKIGELQLTIQKMQVDRDHLDGNMERVQIELEGAEMQLEHVRRERDEAVKGLHEARRKFSQFQAEFGKRLEEDSQNTIRSLRYEIEELSSQVKIGLEHRTEVEHQMGRLREENRRLLFELDELREEKSQVEIQKSQVERSLNALKRKSENIEDELEALKLELLGSEACKKKLEDKDSKIGSLHDEKGILENELKTIQHQMSVELKKTQRLREDLVAEKSKRADLVGRLRSLCTTLSLNGGNVDVEDIDDEQLINSIDDIMMNALVAVKRESDSLRIQQNKQIAELSDLKRDIEKLRRCESESLSESDDRVRELTAENIHTKEQVYLLQEKLRELNLELTTRCNEIEIAKNSIEELNRSSASNSSNNAEVARLQVSIRNSQIQEELVKQENVTLKEELVGAQKQNQKNAQNLEELEAMHKALLSDHARLQHLHNLLTRDYDEAKKETSAMKLKIHEIPRQHAFMSSNLHELEAKLAKEIEQKDQQLRANLELKKEHAMSMDRMRHEIQDVICVRDKLKNELCRVNEQVAKRNDVIDELNKQLAMKGSEISKLSNKIEAISQLNRTYNEENKNLSRQLEILLNQNKELLQRALHDKDQYHLEMKDFQDQLSALRRHKEKLEDKIMDQYRTMESKKTPERKQPLVKRAAKALINRRRAASNGGSTTEDSSAYSADERASPPLADDNDNLPPTCSSSDDHERISPDNLKTQPTMEFRSRNDHIGGSVRLSQSLRRSLGNNSIDHVHCSPYLSPRTPIRNTLATSSLRSRPPPPPYTPPRNNDTSLTFEPTSHSTPIADRHVVAEGEKRESNRDKEERCGKTLSYYENVNETKPSESTIWFEYGCV